MKRIVFILAIVGVGSAAAWGVEQPGKKRLVVMTDIGGDPRPVWFSICGGPPRGTRPIPAPPRPPLHSGLRIDKGNAMLLFVCVHRQRM